MHNCIQTENLQPGMVIVQVTKQNGPLKIRKSGLVTSVEMIQGLLEMGIQEVQIDPNQTVEIETSVIQSSATMQLLQSNSVMPAKADHQLHDQFNRSLFLPSVQDIPSQWQFYAKRSATLTGLIVLGLVLGFAMAYLPSVLALRSPLVVSVPADRNVELAPTIQSVTSAPAAAVTGPAAKLESPETQNDVATQVVNQVTQSELAQAPTEPEIAQAELSQVVKKQDIKAGQLEEQVLTATPVKEEPVSPQLLKRFEKVIQQMDREERYAGKTSQTQTSLENPSTGPIVDLSEFPILDEKGDILPGQDRAETPTVVKDKAVKDVPRIDQLPDWVMKELPSMAFSAHMFASLASERWVRVNGQNMLEGDLIDNKVRIVRIAPQHVILNYAGHEFSMQAMTDW
tara:strand:+ start:284 stop:1480 length:1197 start_codon:yes stop_codon:yes gene_type:complete